MLDWILSPGLTAYPDAVSFMENRVKDIQNGGKECIWLVEHPPLYTAGTSAKAVDLIDATRFPVFESGRGGQFTYHGPGQRVVYVMLNLNRRGPDLRRYVAFLEQWVIETLAEFDIDGFRRPGRIGIWVTTPRGEEKIAAIGVRISKWVTFHGVAINVHPDLEHFSGIVPCGLSQFGVTSCHQLGRLMALADLDQALRRVWDKLSTSLSISSR
jgi:lipoyl(octanoyl) transferase